VIHRLDKAQTSMLVHRRLILRRSVTVADIIPALMAAAKTVLVAVVVLVVHIDLSHHGIVHPLEGMPGSKVNMRWQRAMGRR
jgi:hypothetical protein